VVHGGVRGVSVSNPAPTLASSDMLPLFVSNPAPVIASINAGPITYNNANPGETSFLPLIINLADCSPDSVAWVNPPCDTNGFRKAQITTRISSTQIVATIPIRCTGAYGIQVRTPQPGGGVSNTATLSVPAAPPLSSGWLNPNPTLRSVSDVAAPCGYAPAGAAGSGNGAGDIASIRVS